MNTGFKVVVITHILQWCEVKQKRKAYLSDVFNF